MPLPSTRRPRYFPLSTISPRSTQSWLSGSRIARSTAISAASKLLDADEARAFLREPVVDRPGMGGEKAAARVACCFLHSLGLLRLLRVARGLRGQARKPRRTALPESRVARAVAGKIASALRRC